MLVAAQDAALHAVGVEVADADADRHAGAAAVTQRLVDKVVRAPEACVGQRVVLGDRIGPRQLGDELGLQPVRQIRTAHRRRGAEESQGLDVLTDEHGFTGRSLQRRRRLGNAKLPLRALDGAAASADGTAKSPGAPAWAAARPAPPRTTPADTGK